MLIGMQRRQFIVGTALLSLGVAGCLGTEDNPHTPEGVEVSDYHVVGDVYTGKALDLTGERPQSRHTVITEREVAEKAIETEERDDRGDDVITARDFGDLAEFIEETDFEEEYLVLVLSGRWSSQEWLEVTEVDRTDGGVRMETVVESEDAVTDDARVHSLVIRVKDSDESVPEELRVTVDGESSEPMDAEEAGS
jgi:hypothetical protein